MRIACFLFRQAGNTLILAIMAGVAGGAANAGLLMLINTGLRSEGSIRVTLIWWFIGLCVLQPSMRCMSEMLLGKIGQDALHDLRLKLCRRILSAPLIRIESLGSHRLLTALTDDVPTITNAVAMAPILCINIAVTTTCLVYLGLLSWKLLLAALLFMALGVLTYQMSVLEAAKSTARAREQADSLMKHFQALTRGAKELKLHRNRREEFLSEVLDKTANSMRRHNILGMRIYTMASSWGQMLVFIVIGLAVFGLPAIRATDVNTLSAYAFTLVYLMAPLQAIMNLAPVVGRVGVALKKIEDLELELGSNWAENMGVNLKLEKPGWRSLELMGVRHSYHNEAVDNQFVLGPIDLKLNQGEAVFIMGGNGSGKTTLAKLITGLYRPEAGEIRVDGDPVTDDNREHYRQLFSVVFSDFYLFESLLGLHPAMIDRRAHDYLERLRLGRKVKVTDGALSTCDLSQGQRKRLALLTAYLEDRPIYLFDEWAADQDPVFKEVFYYQLLPELKARGKTVLVISHDDKYYHVGDRVIKLENGKVKYDGHRISADQTTVETCFSV